jgi:myosin heavy subunit
MSNGDGPLAANGHAPAAPAAGLGKSLPELPPVVASFFSELGLSGLCSDYQLLGRGMYAAPRDASGASRAVDDLSAFQVTCSALTSLGCATADMCSIFGLLASLLHLGNAAFTDDVHGNAIAKPGAGAAALAAAGRALHCPQIHELLMHRQLNVRGEQMRIDLRAEQAEQLLRGLLKSLYTLGFAWIVRMINGSHRPHALSTTRRARCSLWRVHCVWGGQVRMVNGVLSVSGSQDSVLPDAAVVIDILDIFGFENFVRNSFEQLCINFANEKLHQLFLYTMFKAEEQVILRERVKLPAVEYCDNYRCLQLLEDMPKGVFHLLDTCCRVNASPQSFCLQVHETHLAECEFLVPTINGNNEDRTFTVRHFAGDVAYQVDDFMQKNTETMETQTRQLLQAPGLEFLRSILEDHPMRPPEPDQPIRPAGMQRDHSFRAFSDRHGSMRSFAPAEEESPHTRPPLLGAQGVSSVLGASMSQILGDAPPTELRRSSSSLTGLSIHTSLHTSLHTYLHTADRDAPLVLVPHRRQHVGRPCGHLDWPTLPA